MNCDALNPMPEAAQFRRSPEEVMRFERMGSAHPMRLSFLRVLLRRLQQGNWTFDRPVFDLDRHGVGRAVYCTHGPERSYALVCFAHDLPENMRSDRVIATAWDATFALYDGTPGADDLDRLAQNVPYQEAGRVTEKELTLSRANRSVRLFEHVVQRLADGLQPDREALAQTGYLMRTTAVYGAGKFGAADRHAIAHRSEMLCPFQAEMLTVWLIRAFTIDLVEHLAKVRGGADAVRLDRENRHVLGVGNSTGLGMAPFLVKHPILLNNWIMVREEALARVRALKSLTDETLKDFLSALNDAMDNAAEWQSEHPIQIEKLKNLRTGLAALKAYVDQNWDTKAQNPWNTVWLWTKTHQNIETQEALVSLLLEPHGAYIDGLSECMSADERTALGLDGAIPAGHIKDQIETDYAWALAPDYQERNQCARFWYVSEDKLEPRLGERHFEEGSEQELPLDIGRQVAALYSALENFDLTRPIAHLLLAQPQHRNIVRRLQMMAGFHYGEIQDNLVSAQMMPIDMLRLKLAFFGANRFDPRSDRWVRISLFQGMPYPDELAAFKAL